MQFDKDVSTLIVFGHPNHELAVFGIMQRVKPHLLFMTDGGGAKRVGETRTGLGSIGLAERARYLNHTEGSFYRALLDRDVAFYQRVAEQVREVIEDLQPEQILTDAIEFYNPVHDVSVPVVRAAMAAAGCTAPLYEIPLVYQHPADEETYRVQQFPEVLRANQFELTLEEKELDQKAAVLDGNYTMLVDQMGPTLGGVSRDEATTEVVGPAPEAARQPGGGYELRYEWRAKLLLDRGEIEEMITFDDHYAPIADALFA